VSGGSPQSTMLTTIMAVDPIYFTFDASEADYLRYSRLANEGKRESSRNGSTQVFLRLADENGWPPQGPLHLPHNQLEPRSGTIRIRAVFDNPDGLLTPGVFGRLRVPGSPNHEAIMIPDVAIDSDQAKKVVMTVKEDGTVVPKPVTLGPIVDGLRVI